MPEPGDYIATGFGTLMGALAIWLVVRAVNRRSLRPVVRPALVVSACLWLPFSWLLLLPGGLSEYRIYWIKIWPVLPGLVPGAYLFHPNSELLEFLMMAVTTLALLGGLTWLANRGWKSLLAAALLALLTSVPTSLLAYALYAA